MALENGVYTVTLEKKIGVEEPYASEILHDNKPFWKRDPNQIPEIESPTDYGSLVDSTAQNVVESDQFKTAQNGEEKKEELKAENPKDKIDGGTRKRHRKKARKSKSLRKKRRSLRKKTQIIV